MISIVTIYNNELLLNSILLPSLKIQGAQFELIKIDNTQGQFRSYAAALNYGAQLANGKYVMFVHQDVEFDSDSWLENIERMLDSIPDLGIAGVVGMSQLGKNAKERGRGYISDCGEIWNYSNAVEKPEEVQTLDECLFIIPKYIFNKLRFDDKNFDGWHCSCIDYCLCVRQIGLKAYVLPAFIYHRSWRLNVKNLARYHKIVYNKHKKNYRHIYTTTGEISWLKTNLRLIMEVLLPLYKRLSPSLSDVLKKELAGCNSVLDLGCGYNSPIQNCAVSFTIGVELFEPYLQESSKKGIHSQYIKADIKKVEFKPKSFDAVLATEVLEHLTKEEGIELLQKMEIWAKKRIVITTPNGYIAQEAYDNNPLQRHTSVWIADELRKYGYRVSGLNGYKKLRGYKASVKYKPYYFWVLVSALSQKLTYYYPKFSFQLFAVKDVSNKLKL